MYGDWVGPTLTLRISRAGRCLKPALPRNLEKTTMQGCSVNKGIYCNVELTIIHPNLFCLLVYGEERGHNTKPRGRGRTK